MLAKFILWTLIFTSPKYGRFTNCTTDSSSLINDNLIGRVYSREQAPTWKQYGLQSYVITGAWQKVIAEAAPKLVKTFTCKSNSAVVVAMPDSLSGKFWQIYIENGAGVSCGSNFVYR